MVARMNIVIFQLSTISSLYIYIFTYIELIGKVSDKIRLGRIILQWLGDFRY